MKINLLRIVLLILLFGTFYIIFGFSSQDGEESGGISSRVTEFILEKSNTYKNIEENRQDEIFERTEKIIRKIAHFSIYALVGFLLMGLVSTFKLKEKTRILISLILGVLYAASDEIHQLFSPGRSAQITDVYIDTLGVLVGIFVILLFIKVFEKMKLQKHKEKLTKNEYYNILY